MCDVQCVRGVREARGESGYRYQAERIRAHTNNYRYVSYR
mgnify:CR=1 FL=1|jgi:hypothetical protein